MQKKSNVLRNRVYDLNDVKKMDKNAVENIGKPRKKPNFKDSAKSKI